MSDPVAAPIETNPNTPKDHSQRSPWIPFLIGITLTSLVFMAGIAIWQPDFANKEVEQIATKQSTPLSEQTEEDIPISLPIQQEESTPISTAVPERIVLDSDLAAADSLELQGDYVHKLIDPRQAMFDFGMPYPTSMREIEESDLVELKCSPRFVDSSYNGLLLEESDNSIAYRTITDPVILEFIYRQGEQLTSMTYCATSEGKVLIAYGVRGIGGGAGDIMHVGYLTRDSQLTNASEFASSNAYFGCRTPIVLTNTATLYFRCAAGDGAGATASVFAIDLNTQTTVNYYHCDIIEDIKTEISCEGTLASDTPSDEMIEAALEFSKFMRARMNRDTAEAETYLSENALAEYRQSPLTLVGTSSPHFSDYKITTIAVEGPTSDTPLMFNYTVLISERIDGEYETSGYFVEHIQFGEQFDGSFRVGSVSSDPYVNL